MKIIIAIVLAFCIGQAAAQDCRTAFGGVYTFAHTGIKPNGTYFSALAKFTFQQDGTFAVNAVINGRGAAPYSLNITSDWWWSDACAINVDRPGFIGLVSDDGRFISLATFDDEQMAGVAIRDTP